MPSNSDSGRSANDRITLGRRTFLAGTASVATVGLAGCSAVVDFLADIALKDVNVFNQTEQEHSGDVSVVDPDGEVVLEDSFEVDANNSDDDDQEGTMERFTGVLDAEGTYEVTVDMADGDDVDGQQTAETTADVEKPGEEKLVVGLGAENADDPISVVVIESLSDLEEFEES